MPWEHCHFVTIVHYKLPTPGLCRHPGRSGQGKPTCPFQPLSQAGSSWKGCSLLFKTSFYHYQNSQHPNPQPCCGLTTQKGPEPRVRALPSSGLSHWLSAGPQLATWHGCPRRCGLVTALGLTHLGHFRAAGKAPTQQRAPELPPQGHTSRTAPPPLAVPVRGGPWQSLHPLEPTPARGRPHQLLSTGQGEDSRRARAPGLRLHAAPKP